MSGDFNERHKSVGVVTNQPDGYDAARPHAATLVCDRPGCQEKAKFWVQGITGEQAHFKPYARSREAKT
jgi:hypothetical protein